MAETIIGILKLSFKTVTTAFDCTLLPIPKAAILPNKAKSILKILN
jgi:hypothetical protein